MATEEQEAFIKEMQQTKPKYVWLELWEARQILGLRGVETPVEIDNDQEPIWSPEYVIHQVRKGQIVVIPGEWYPFPIHGDVPDLEWMRDGLGRVRFRMAQTE